MRSLIVDKANLNDDLVTIFLSFILLVMLRMPLLILYFRFHVQLQLAQSLCFLASLANIHENSLIRTTTVYRQLVHILTGHRLQGQNYFSWMAHSAIE